MASNAIDMYSSSVPMAMGWILLLDSNYGLLNVATRKLIGQSIFSISSIPGIMWVHIALTTVPVMVIVPPSLPANNIKELIALARAKPGTLSYGTSGVGSIAHLGTELLKFMAGGIDIVHVPYKGTGQALSDVLGGQVQLMMASLLPALPHVKSARLRGIAVTSAQRTAALPETPTVAESGLPGFETTSWHGMVMPAKTPASISGRVHAEMVKLLNLPDVKAFFLTQGMDTVGNTPAQFTAYIQGETEKWSRVVRTLGIPPQ